MKLITEDFSAKYHGFLAYFFIAIGSAITFYCNINEYGLSDGIILSVFLLIAGTIAFLILPLSFITFGELLFCGAILALPYWTIKAIGVINGESNILSQNGMLFTFFLSIIISLFGYFNCKTLIKAGII